MNRLPLQNDLILFSSQRLRIIVIRTNDVELVLWITNEGGYCYFYECNICIIRVHPRYSYHNILSYLKNSYEPPRGIWQVGKYDIEID